MSEYAKGLEGVIANESALSNVEGKEGRLSYLGYSIEDLVENCCYEEVVYLLHRGRLPTQDELTEAIVGAVAGVGLGIAAGVAVAAGCATLILCLLAILVAVLIAVVTVILGAIAGGNIGRAAGEESGPSGETEAGEGVSLSVGDLITVRGNLATVGPRIFWWVEETTYHGEASAGLRQPYSYCDIDLELPAGTEGCIGPE